MTLLKNGVIMILADCVRVAKMSNTERSENYTKQTFCKADVLADNCRQFATKKGGLSNRVAIIQNECVLFNSFG